MYLCIFYQEGEAVVRRNMKTDPALFLKVIAPYREDLVVAVECIFTWYCTALRAKRWAMPISSEHSRRRRYYFFEAIQMPKNILARLEKKHGRGKR